MARVRGPASRGGSPQIALGTVIGSAVFMVTALVQLARARPARPTLIAVASSELPVIVAPKRACRVMLSSVGIDPVDPAFDVVPTHAAVVVIPQ
jgi:hypothetical protein